MRRLPISLAALTAAAVLLAACGDDGGGTGTTTDTGITDQPTGFDGTTGTAEPPVEEGIATVDVGTNGLLVDAGGFTLYVFDNDMGATSACTGGCLDVWPPLTVGAEPIPGPGIDGTLLGTAEQPDGRIQVTYNGHLLYRYSGDTAPGQTNGDGVGGLWHVIDGSGNPVT